MMKTIPTEEQCYLIMEEHDMLDNITAHSIQVKNIALALWQNLIHKETMSRELVIAGALLHDIAKTWSIKTGEIRHDTRGGEMLREMDMPEIAYIVESHVFFENYNHDGPVEARELVFYADKRVMHDTIVTLDNRVEDLVERYGKTDKIAQLIRRNKEFVLKMEKKINRESILDINVIIDNL